MSRRDRRVNLALKWHYLDNLSADEIRDRFEREGIADLTTSTIRDYLSEKPKEEVIQTIEEQNANVRLQAAERFEGLYQRAREAEREATQDEQVTAMVPQIRTVSQHEEPMRVADWERAPPGDDRRPDWADERDVVVVFVDEDRHLRAGDEYPAGARRGGYPARPGTFPEFRAATVGVERDQPDPKGQAMARNEQAKYQHEKADVLGAYSTDVNLNVDGEMETTLSLDETAAAAIREADLKEGTDE